MIKHFLKDAFIWGFILWLVGYLLGIVFFPLVPSSFLGWWIMPIGILITLWVLQKKVKAASVKYFLFMAIIWVSIAIVCDYFFLVKLFKPADGYYKLDVYVYYALTFLLPLFICWRKVSINRK